MRAASLRPSGLTHIYERSAGLVPGLARDARRVTLPDAETVAAAIGLGRVLLGGGFLAAPVASTRFLGADSASAKRMAFLARMTAARDIALGAGTLATARERSGALWVAAGAAADAADAVAIAAGLRRGTLRGVGAIGMVFGAAGASAVGFWAARGLRRR